jgi:tetratricopeptide (TPR) repeat protein
MLRGGAPVPGPRGWPWARLVPSALLLALIPIALRTSSAVDARHLVPNGAGALLGEMVAPLRLLALLNLALFLVPLLPLLPVAYWASRPGRDPALRWLVTLAVCWLIPCFLIHPVQGEFRDWDDFAAAGVAAALPLAWLLIRSPARTAAPLAIALAGAAAVPRIQWLALQASPERALARIEAWATAPHPPLNTAVAAALEHVAMIHFKQGRLDDARRAMKASLAEARWVRVLLEWANAEAQQGDWTLAQSLYDQAARMRPDDPGVWVFMAQGAFRRGDRNAAIRAVTALKRIAPADPRIGQIEAAISALPVPP